MGYKLSQYHHHNISFSFVLLSFFTHGFRHSNQGKDSHEYALAMKRSIFFYPKYSSVPLKLFTSIKVTHIQSYGWRFGSDLSSITGRKEEGIVMAEETANQGAERGEGKGIDGKRGMRRRRRTSE